MKRFFNRIGDWLFVGARLPIVIIAFIIIAVTAITVTVSVVNKEKTEYVTAFVTVEGFGEDVDFADRHIKIVDGDSVKNIFSLEYKDIYNDFGKPFIHYNQFQSFLGFKAENGKKIQVRINGVDEPNLEHAYVYEGYTISIKYV